MRHVYADAVGHIEAMHGVIKLELVSFKAGTGDADGAFDTVAGQGLVMMPETLARLHAALLQVQEQLLKDGILQQATAERAR